MNLTHSIQLLRNYTDNADETAFRELVERYVDLVYSTAVRRVGGDVELAQDVTQRVFADLALKARALRKMEHLGGWLHRHTGFVASTLHRSEQRRRIREQEAAQMNATISESPDSLWQRLEPVLDETIEQLEPPERQAILLRFFERQDFRSVGNALGISDDAAQKRVSRAIEKLRSLLTERGVTLSVVLLSALLAGRVINAAPAGLAVKAAKFAMAGAAGAAAGGLVSMLAKISESVALKLVIGGVVVAVAAWLVWRHSSASEAQHDETNNVQAMVGSTNAVKASSQLAQTVKTASAVGTTETNATGRFLTVNVVAADSGKPVPDVEFDYWLWINGGVRAEKPLHATRFGVCKVPILDNTTELSIVSERDGFADTLLDWHVDRGEQIPSQYTLRVARAVAIGGTVLDPDGNPVAGAEVGFNNGSDPALQTRPQSDDFSWPFWITAKSDAQGHWEIDRIGKAALKSIYGSASHPGFVGTPLIFPGRDANAQTQLLAEAYVLKLGRAVVVQGVVKDPDGQPVSGAMVLIGQVGSGNSRKGKSRADGTFSITGCQPGKNVITVQAMGFAASTLDVNLTNNSGTFELILRPGKVFKLRVVDGDGNPVPHATVWLDTFQRGPVDSQTSAPPQVYFQRQTDANGRLRWDEAPDGKLNFTASADGYIRSGDREFQADGTEHVITLQHGLTISGTVTDATTGQPIPKFRIVAGWPNYDPITHGTNFSWSTIDRFWLSFVGGSFQYTWDEPVLGGAKDPEYVFKIEADGYAPFITRVIHASEGSVQFDLRLTPAPSTEVTVLSPDNERAANIDIGLASPGARLSLVPGGFSRENLQSGGTLLMTDSAGQFSLPSDDTIKRVIAASPQGYAEATPADLTANPVLQLQPWGQVEGTLAVDGRPSAGRVVSIGFSQENRIDMISCDSTAFQATTDDQGRFTIPMAPPGEHEIIIMAVFTNQFGTGWTSRSLQPVNISSGTDTVITIDTPANPEWTPAMLKKYGVRSN